VFTRPDARPESCRPTPLVAVIAAETNEHPMPAAHNSDGASMSTPPRDWSRRPLPSSVRPSASTRPEPTRAASLPAAWVQTRIVSDIGRNARPARSGE
jgi:hypothetical protein